MHEIHFSFGPENTYALVTPKLWKFHTNDDLNYWFKPERGRARLFRPYWVALGQGDANVASGRGYGGTDELFSNISSYRSSQLHSWLRKPKKRGITVTSRLSFGPGPSYCLCNPAENEYISHELTPELDRNLRCSKEKPRSVALGVGGAYVVLYPNGQVSWDCRGMYGELDVILGQEHSQRISHIALSPFSADQYFIAYVDGSVKYRVPATCALEIKPLIKDWQTEMASGTVSGSSLTIGVGPLGSVLEHPKEAEAASKDIELPTDNTEYTELVQKSSPCSTIAADLPISTRRENCQLNDYDRAELRKEDTHPLRKKPVTKRFSARGLLNTLERIAK